MSHCILSADVDAFVSRMKGVELAELLRDVLDIQIRKCRKEMLDTYTQIEVERIQAQIMAYQWVQTRIQDLVIEYEGKGSNVKV